MPDRSPFHDPSQDKPDPKMDYCYSTHSQVGELAKSGWKACGEVKDRTLDQRGTLVVMRRPKKEATK